MAAGADTDVRTAIGSALDGFAGRHWPLAAVHALEESGEFPRDVWEAFADLGWLRALRPESEDGLGLGPHEAAILFERAGRHLVPGPLFDSVVVSALAGVPDGLLGEAGMTSFAWAEPEAETSPACDLTSLADGRVRGRKVLVEHADVADVLVVAASDGGACSLVAVDPRAPEVTIERLPCIDALSRPCDVAFEGAEPLHLLAAGEEAQLLVDRLRDWSLVMHAASLLGVAERALEMSVAYAMDRRQFGQAIASFQAVKHRLADMATLTITGRSACEVGQRALGAAGRPGRSARVAKAYLSAGARSVLESAIQVHGGIGFTAEHDLHLLVKRVLTLEAAWGDASQHADALGRELLERVGDERTTRQEG